jgi:predicted nucleotidyltransferase
MSIYNLSNDKIPQHIRDIISALRAVLGKQFYDFLLIGASARDLIMDGVYDLGISRLTKDVDFAIYVPEWDDYTNVLTKLVASGRFTPTKITHKLMFDQAYEIDIVPFGDIQDANGRYSWPPDLIKAMNVTGFVEVSEGGLEIKSTADETGFRVASVPGLCVMKLLAWNDRVSRTIVMGKISDLYCQTT